MEEVARVYSEALFEAAQDRGKLDEIHEQLDQFADAVAGNRDLQVFLFSPYFSSSEKREGIERTVSGAEPELINFLALLIEKGRMPLIFRVRDRFDDLWAEASKRLEVTVTSAVELDPEIVKKVGEEIERQTGRTIDLRSEVDDQLLGGLRLQVGNMVLDASLRNKLERLRKEIAQAV
jgi:F-type H+-transporting ATPase subunit delta